ncbi:MAG: 1-acyl-sn-glycerol-3-phosphate acyltransferase [Paludibacteraceae bacterium]|nr:1-acyl-sn-glycerol-3-phosphate acyltransferase [Paludibacteraceae bacterium]MCR5570315.1 1-acyl-sn-glycerol-3-phosphate acyltransferase [Paludibacteraceae bacterium]
MEKPLLKSICLRLTYKVLFRPVLKFFVGVQYPDCSFLKDEKQFVIIANHNSHLDTLSLLTSLPGEILWKVKPVAAEDYFGNTKLKAKLSNFFINTLLINRHSKREDGANYSMNRMLKAIDDGYSLILFPEGSRGEPEQMSKMKSGIARLLVQKPGLKYVPVFMTGMGTSLPKGGVLILPYNATLHFGKPTLPESDDPHTIMDQIEKDFGAMVEKYGIKDDDDDE